ncbi:hypothetical protein evm_010227 [Chilo suppressalis]|nr:hypothetical protein evm_010227 [Chilo suppressalis]
MRQGINPLHDWIRILEFLLHLSYENDALVRKWRINKNSKEGEIVERRKIQVQTDLRSKLGLLVDVVKSNSGTTNDGNTARTALSDKNRAIFTDILGLEPWLTPNLRRIDEYRTLISPSLFGARACHRVFTCQYSVRRALSCGDRARQRLQLLPWLLNSLRKI